MSERLIHVTFQYSFSYSTEVGEDAKTNMNTKKEKKSRTNLTLDDVRKEIWKASNRNRRYPLNEYHQIMEYLIQEFDADCVESLRSEDYESIIKALKDGVYKT